MRLSTAALLLGIMTISAAEGAPVPGPLPPAAKGLPPGVDWEAVPESDPLILQWFEGSWATMARRMGDAFVAGYRGLWVPPPGRGSGSGDFVGQIGYDLYDRFDFGQKNPVGTPTRYGDTRQMGEMLNRSRRARIATYYDSIMNHNGSGTHSNQGFVDAGGYPGFALSFGGDQWGDFNPPGGSDDLTGYLAGLIDIDQSKNHSFIRQPAAAASNNVPGAGEKPNQPIRLNHRRFYPDLNPAPGDVLTASGFNLTNPLGGDPVPENATGYLLRYTRYMNEVIGYDGIRIDAVKHIPTWYFTNLWDATIAGRGRRKVDGSATTPFSFGEAFTGDVGQLMSYHNRGAGTNRTVLDFAHYFTINSVFNAGGFGNLEDIVRSSIDYADDTNGFNGSAGVFFIASHDKEGGGGSNIGNFWVSLRKGHGIIYHNAAEFPPVSVNGSTIDFPKAGGSRGDAIGAFPPDDLGRISLIADIADIRRRFAHGNWRERWLSSDYLVLEYEGRLVYALSDRADEGTFNQSVTTGFPAGTQLVELTGNARRANQRAGNSAIPTEITVGTGGTVPLVIPRNVAQFGYVAYGPRTPGITATLSNVAEVLPPDPGTVPAATRRLTPVRRVTADSSVLSVQVDSAVRGVLVNIGNQDLNSSGGPDILRGGLAGFEFMNSAGGNAYQLPINWAGLGDGWHYVEVIAPAGGGAGEHGLVWSSERFTVHVDREAPNGRIATPLTPRVTEAGQVSVHLFSDGTEDNALVHIGESFGATLETSAFTQMFCAAPNEWSALVDATLTRRAVTVRLFEETGRSRDVTYLIPGPEDTTPTPTPDPDPEVIQAPWLAAAPTLDGVVSANEYSAGGVNAALTPDPTKNSFGDNNEIGVMRVANDDSNLYIGLEGFKLSGQPNAFVLYLDTTAGNASNGSFGVGDVGKLADYGPTSPAVANAQEALSVALNASPWPGSGVGNVNFRANGGLTAEFGFAITGTQAVNLDGLPADDGVVGLFGFPELGSTTQTTDFWFLSSKAVGSAGGGLEIAIPFAVLQTALPGHPLFLSDPLGPENTQNQIGLAGFILNGDNGDISDEFIPAQSAITGTTLNNGAGGVVVDTRGAIFRLGREAVTPTPYPTAWMIY